MKTRQAGTKAIPRQRSERLAALDLGTNNCRLLVVEPRPRGFRVLRSFSRITRLGEGLAATGRLDEAAMTRTIAALSACARLIEVTGAERVRCVATEACRRAANGREFVERVRRVTGLPLEILDSHEEARLAMLGCAPLVERDARRVLLLDIGGGSTEIFWLERPNGGATFRGRAHSLPVGVVTLSETSGDGADERVYRRMVAAVTRLIEAAGMPPAANGDAHTIQMLGTSGTVTTLAAVHLGLKRYDRRRVDGTLVSFAALSEVAERLRRLDRAGRAAYPCIGHGRADLVMAGCAILEAVHRRWPVERLRVADRGLREGILAEMLGQDLALALAGPAVA